MDPAAKSTRLAILVAEDDALLAADLEETIRRCGHACVGPAGSLAEILGLVENDHVDVAILDVRLRHGEKAYPAADLLAARGIPFAFVTAYGSAHIDPRYAHCRILAKPVLREELELLVQELTRSHGPPHHQTLTEPAGSSSFDHRS
jgi:two-component SAPR family response regulator